MREAGMFTQTAEQTANARHVEQLAQNIIGSMRETGMFTHTADETANAANIEQLVICLRLVDEKLNATRYLLACVLFLTLQQIS